jgi:spore maturation protein CgeB
MHQHAAKAREMAERGYAHVHAKFTFETMIDRTEAVYRELVPDR